MSRACMTPKSTTSESLGVRLYVVPATVALSELGEHFAKRKIAAGVSLHGGSESSHCGWRTKHEKSESVDRLSLTLGMGLFTRLPSLSAEPAKATDAATKPAEADDLKKVAASLDGYVFQFPSKAPMPEHPKPGADGDSALVPPGGDPKKTDNFTAEKQFGGTKGKRST